MTAEFISKLQKQDIKLFLQEGKLKVNAPNGALTEPLLKELALRKPQLLAFLQQAQLPSDYIARHQLNDELPLSFSQLRLWFLDRLDPNHSLYPIFLATRLSGPLNLPALHDSLNRIVARHDALRTSFTLDQRELPIQIIAPVTKLPLPVIMLDPLCVPERETLLNQIVMEEARAPFDLGSGPLFRAKLVRLSQRDHVLMLNMHHIISDGESLAILFHELTHLYKALSSDQPPSLAPLPIQYADYAAWQQGKNLVAQLAYWRLKLGKPQSPLALPLDFPRPAVQTYRGSNLSFMLSRLRRSGLTALGNQEGATLFMVLLASFYALLYRYSLQSDVTIGIPISNRDRAELVPLIGLFVNTLALRVHVPAGATFRSLLAETRLVTLGGYEHQMVPFEQVVADLSPVRDQSRSPLFQVFFSLNEQSNVLSLDVAGLSFKSYDADDESAKFDLSLMLSDHADGLHASFNFNADLFKPCTIQNMIRHFQKLISEVVRLPDLPLNDLSLLDVAERTETLECLNETGLPLQNEVAAFQLFEERVALHPLKLALSCSRNESVTSLNYAELNRRANCLAAHLITLGVGPEVPVAICLERGPQLVCALLAIHKAGGAFVPLDPAYPCDRLLFVLNATHFPIVITQACLSLPKSSAHLIFIDDQGTLEGSSALDAAPNFPARCASLSHIIFTSGSTGSPKGVAIGHRNVAALLYWMKALYSAEDLQSVLASTSVCFDLSVFEIFGTLALGGKIVLVDNVLALQHLNTPVSLINTVPSAMWELLALDAVPPSVSVVNLAGEPLSQALCQKIYELPSVVRVFNLYGPSEDTTYSSCCLVARDTIPSIGRPISHSRAYLLDPNLMLAPPGLPRLLFLSGAGLARGYFDQPALTALRFLPDPYAAVPGARMYDSGDRARLLDDGNLAFVGRADRQVKVRGFRIELGEIESCLECFPDLDRAVVTVHDEGSDRFLHAWVQAPDRVSSDLLRCHLLARLPLFMVPSFISVLPSLPLTPNGKIDVQALSLLGKSLPCDNKELVAPRNDNEELLLSAFELVLQRGGLGIHDDFFALGGHSLLAMRLISRINSLFGVDIPLRSIFDAPSVAQLAVEVTLLKPADLVPLVRVARDLPLPLSFAQERLWFLYRLAPDTAAYNVPTSTMLQDFLDVNALRLAFQAVVERHEILRTSFCDSGESPLQLIGPAPVVMLPVIDLSLLSRDCQDALLRRLAAMHAAQIFVLERGPLWRLDLLRRSVQEHVLLLTLHHIVTDAWSNGILMGELLASYKASTTGQQQVLPELPVQYADFAVWQRQRLQGPLLAAQMDFWLSALAGPLPMLELPIDFVRTGELAGKTQLFAIEEVLCQQCRALCLQQGITLYMFFLSVFKVLLYRYCGQADVIVGTPIANRNLQQIEPLIGCFINTLALRFDLSGNPPFSQMLKQTREVALGAYTHQDLPFETLVAELDLERDLNRTPVFQVMFQLEQVADRSEQTTPYDTEQAKFDLSLTMSDQDGALSAGLQFNSALYRTDSIARLVQHFRKLCAEALANPELCIDDFQLLDDAERHFLLVTCNATSVPLLPQNTFQLFEAKAAALGNRPALIFEDDLLSWQDLLARARGLGHYLQKRGVGPEQRVGIHAHRSQELVIALLGIFAAGAAYVPLDPELPEARLDFIAKDAGLEFVLSADPLVPGDCCKLDIKQKHPDQGPLPPVATEHAAYMIYTSGTTGKPKGTILSHRALVNHNAWMVAAFGLCEDDRSLQKTPFSFDVSVEELTWPLICGATLVIARPDGHSDPLYLANIIEKQAITTLHLVPTLLLAMLEFGSFPDSLRRIFCGGEILSDQLRQRLHQATRAELFNLYGPTESAIHATAWRSVPRCDGQVPIGRAIQNIQTYVVAANGQLAPRGVAGELHLGGMGLARGYHGQPRLTASCFIPNPFSSRPGDRLYRSGDWCRYLFDGEILFLNRIDLQTKLRGNRIELAEIEAVLIDLASVSAAAVTIEGAQSLVAYITSTTEISAPELQAQLSTQLPSYMIPSSFRFLESLPLTASGKLDRTKLSRENAVSLAEFQRDAPTNTTEDLICSAFEQVLERDAVGIHQDFFALGGHSLLAMKLTSRVNLLFGLDLPLRALFEAATVAKLAVRVAGLQSGASASVPRISRDQPLPLSFAQERLWYLFRLAPDSTAYNVPSTALFHGVLDAKAIILAFQALVERHEMLRTSFFDSSEAPQQRIEAPTEVHISLVDLSHLDCDCQAFQGRLLAAKHAALNFDLERGPLWRFDLLRCSLREHVLLFTLHHIITDGWSNDILMGELMGNYKAALKGQELVHPEQPIQYGDYAVWQRQQLQGLASQMSYWQEHLSGTLPTLNMPTDFVRPAEKRGKTLFFTLDAKHSQRGRVLCQQQGVTLFMLYLSVFKVLLHRYSGQSEVIVGTPIANRNQLQLEPLVGCFVNTLALRIKGRSSFIRLLEHVRALTLSAYSHQDLPFEKIVAELDLPRDMNRTPVFQVMFQLVQKQGRSEETSPLPYESASDQAKFDLNLSMREQNGAISAGMQYNTGLFSDESIARLIQHFLKLCAAVFAHPEQCLDDLQLLDEAERHYLLVTCNATCKPIPDQSIFQLFEAQAAARGSRTALIFDDVSLSWLDLLARARGLGHYLKKRGVGPEHRVGIHAERSLELVIALYGILAAGAAYVPLDPELPEARLDFITKDAGLEFVLSADQCVPGGCCKLDIKQKHPDRGPLPPLQAEQAAYMIYTSGTTGKPKGTILNHRALLNHNLWMVAAFGLSEEDRTLQKTPFSFDVSVEELTWPMICGATMIIARPGGQADPLYLAEIIEKQAITTLHLVPTLLQAMLEAGPFPGEGSLRRVFCGGEMLSDRLRQRFHEVSPAELYNLYGPTESAIHATAWCSVPRCDGQVPIGRPIQNIRAYVVAAKGQLAPRGVAGELHLGGMGLARGYHGQTKLTATNFIPNAYSGRAGDRLYRTGDWCRHLNDGEIVFLNRVDQQAKLRGNRIELTEIEAALIEIEAVTAAAVVIEGVSLEAYLTLAPGTEVTTPGLQAQLSTGLPGYMVPALYRILETMPLTASGKLDRAKLSRENAVRLEGDQAREGPRNAAEELISSVFEQVLGRAVEGIHEDFFTLGGHSLLAMRLISRVNQLFGLELPLRAIFDAATVAKLAERVAEQETGETVPLERVSRDQPMPLSFAQERLWILYRLAPDVTAYNVPSSAELQGPLDIKAINLAFQMLVERHEILRTTLNETAAAPQQCINPSSEVKLPVVDLSGHSRDSQEAEVRLLVAKQSAQQFDLERGPLWRLDLLRRSLGEHVLLLTLHHMVTDGWSNGILMQELMTYYLAITSGQEPDLPVLPIQYADFAAWQRRRLQGAQLEAQMSYWKEHLAGTLPILGMPSDYVRPVEQTFGGKTLDFTLEGEVSQRARTLSQREGVTHFMFYLSAFKVLLQRYSGQTDVIVGTPIANRNHPLLEPLIGCFVNSLALRFEVPGEATFLDMLKQTRAVTLAAYTHQELPFEKLVAELDLPRDMSRTPIFQVMFQMVQVPCEQRREQILTLAPLETEGQQAKFDLTLAMTEQDGVIRASIQYNVALYKDETIARLKQHYLNLITEAITHPEQSLNALQIHDEAERNYLLETCNGSRKTLPEQTSYQLFEAKATALGSRTALIYEDEQLSWQELQARARGLGHYLQERGVGPEHRVGIHAERSLELVIAIYGIFAAGAAYVPLDPELPAARLAYIAEDAGLEFVLSDKGFVGACSILDIKQRHQGRGPQPTVLGEHAAYLIYTSGSTGKPKGAILSHRALVNHNLWIIGAFGLGEEDRLLQKTPFSFDVSVGEFTWPMICGTTMVIARPGGHTDPHYLVGKIQQAGITTIHLVPTMLKAMLEVGTFPSTLRRVLCVGEVLPARTCQRYHEQGSAELHNLYGPTEAAIHVTGWQSEQRDDGQAPIGRPIQNIEVYVVTAAGHLALRGVAGELHLGGVGLARGYHGRPGLTATSFIPDPYSGRVGDRLYRTGDLCRYLSDGEIQYLSRIDQQAKFRGNRIELTEIEMQLLEVTAVTAAAVAIEQHAGAETLVAYLTRAPETELSTQQLQTHLSTQLPSYMIPTHYKVLERMPLMASGKLDRARLARASPEKLPGKVEVIPPRNTAELRLTKIWERVLEKGPISMDDNFFQLGGHSLMGVRLVKEIEEEFGAKYPLEHLFRTPTIEAQALQLGRKETEERSPLVTIQASSAGTPLYCVHPAGGGVLCYAELARLLGPEQPVYGIQSRGMFDEPQAQIEEMATYYIEALRQVQPEGPYQISGWSFGAPVAYEIASQLQATGNEVALLALIDGFVRTESPPEDISKDTYVEDMLATFQIEKPEQDETWDGEKAIRDWAIERHLISPSMGGQLRRFWQNNRMSGHAYRNWKPSKYKGRVTLIRCPIEEGEENPTRDWQHCAEEVELLVADGTHMTILKQPHVETVAQYMRERLT